MIKKVLKVPVAVIQRGSFFLFQRRKKSPYKNYLGLIGGKIESAEDLKSALTREVFEESSLIVKDLHPVALVSEFFYTKKISTKLNFLYSRRLSPRRKS
jgi:ADP-ribose pyrophosphatase YjhB (NUDIX family)